MTRFILVLHGGESFPKDASIAEVPWEASTTRLAQYRADAPRAAALHSRSRSNSARPTNSQRFGVINEGFALIGDHLLIAYYCVTALGPAELTRTLAEASVILEAALC
jgi:hypothetical protein